MAEWQAEFRVDEALARRLVRTQFADVAGRRFELLGEGWDTVVWLVDDEWVFRFPRTAWVVRGLEKEIAYLPALAPLLPLSIPVPMLVGEPSAGFEWPFYGAPFIPGRELAGARLDEGKRAELGRTLGAFLRTLHSLDLDADLPVDPVRRGDMTLRVPKTRERLVELEEAKIWSAPPAAHAVVDAAAQLPPPEPAAVVHGDLHLRHILVDDDGGPSGVIDWIDLSRNDRGVDLVLYWSALAPAGRAAFRDAYGAIGEAELLRGRILALFLCGTLALWGHHEDVEPVKRGALEGLERTLRE